MTHVAMMVDAGTIDHIEKALRAYELSPGDLGFIEKRFFEDEQLVARTLLADAKERLRTGDDRGCTVEESLKASVCLSVCLNSTLSDRIL